MRTFDYQHLPNRLFDGKVGDANVRAYEDRGKLQLLEQLHSGALEKFRAKALFDNVESSMHIEGLYLDPARAKALMAGDAPAGETEAQMSGYATALRAVQANHGDMGLSTTTILALYEALYAHRNLGRKSRYRKKDYLYVQVDGHPQAMPVSPINAFETPLVLGGACDALEAAFRTNSCSPLVLNATFIVDFLCIRPFDEGNGRIARLFAELMLEKAGFSIANYMSIDRIIEGTAMEYYDALNACVEGWDRNSNDYGPFALYWLEVIHKAHAKLFDELDIERNGKAGKAERVRLFVKHAAGPVRKRQVLEALPDVSEATVEAALGAMVKEGVIEKMGAARATSYRWL